MKRLMMLAAAASGAWADTETVSDYTDYTWTYRISSDETESMI